jgi:hypothetical protein
MFVIGFVFVITASKTHLHAACEGKSRTILAQWIPMCVCPGLVKGHPHAENQFFKRCSKS